MQLSTGAVLRHWSAWLPLAISLFFVALAVRFLLMHGGPIVQADEGTEAHLFQLLMPVQVLVILYFAATWLPRAPRPASVVLALQLAAWAGLIALVWTLEHSG